MRVLIYSVSAGAGHVRAAEAIQAAFRRYHPHVEVEHVDVMKLVPQTFRKAYSDTYLKMVNSLPSIWGWLYSRTDRIPQTSALVSVRKYVQKLNTKAILEHAAERSPDAIIATHFLPAEIFSDLLGRKRTAAKLCQPSGSAPVPPVLRRPKLAVVITDHDVHQLWVHPNIDRYYTASAEIAHLLAEREIGATTIRPTGIPCDPVFGDLIDEPARQRLKKMMGIPTSPSPTLLMNVHGCGLTGATAASSLGKVLTDVLKKGPPKTVLVVCGRNESMRAALEKSVQAPPESAVRFYGYVTNMHELMGISDLVVTKPGGLTTAECLARCLPMVLVSPIPGQEERNAEMLLEQGCAVLARTPASLTYKLDLLLSDPDRLNRMRESCRRIGKPSAAAEIAGDILRMCKPGTAIFGMELQRELAKR